MHSPLSSQSFSAPFRCTSCIVVRCFAIAAASAALHKVSTKCMTPTKRCISEFTITAQLIKILYASAKFLIRRTRSANLALEARRVQLLAVNHTTLGLQAILKIPYWEFLCVQDLLFALSNTHTRFTNYGKTATA